MADRCVAGCGFFGSAEKQGYCSKCYNEAKANGKIIEKPAESVPEAVPEISEQQIIGSLDLNDKSRRQCFTCKKKLGISGFDCRCGYLFCAQHRLAEQHQCSFDYKKFQQAELAKKNEAVVAEKLEKV